jgi:hypothetical protein
MVSIGILVNERENRRKSIVTSILFLIIIVILSLWPIVSSKTQKAIEKQYAIEIKFDSRGGDNSFKGRAAEGAQRPRNRQVELAGGSSASKTPPAPAKTQTSASKPVQSTVESKVFDNKSDVKASAEADLEMNDIPTAKKTTSSKSNKVVVKNNSDAPAESVPTKKTNSNTGSGSGSGKTSGSGSGSNTSSNRDGTGSGQGKSGSGNGNDKSGNDGSSGKGTGGGGTGITPGTGVFDGSGKGIFSRQPIKKPAIRELKLDQSGRIKFKICIDRKGISTFVDFVSSGSSIKDKKAVKLAIDYVGRFVWEEDYDAQKEQCGVYTLIIDNSKK